MKDTVKRKYRVWEYDEEERWINKLAKVGSNLTGVEKGIYHFEDGEADEYEYKVMMLRHDPSSSKGQAELQEQLDRGIECVGTVGKSAYLRKHRDDYDSYFDDDSIPRMKYLKRMNLPIILVVLVAFILGFILLWKGMTGGIELFKYLSIPCYLAGLLCMVGYIMIKAEIKKLKNRIKRR